MRGATAATSLVLALSLAGCGGRPAADPAALAPTPTAAASSPAAAATGAPADPGGPSAGATTAPATAHDPGNAPPPATTSPPPASAPPATAGAGAPSAPSGSLAPTETGPVAAAPRAPGTYRYDTAGTMVATGGDERRLPDVTTLTVHPHEDGRQLAVRDTRDEQGRGQLSETEYAYRRDGVYLARIRVTTDLGGGLRSTREWRLDVPELLVAAGAQPGYRRAFTLRNEDTTADVVVELLRRETVQVAGRPVDTVVTRIHIALSGAVEGSQTSVAWTRPADLLTVQEHVESDARSGPLQVRVDYRATLQSLEPTR